MTMRDESSTASGVSSTLNAGLVALQRQFLEGLEARIIRMEAAAVTLRSNQDDAAALSVVRRECHKIAGIAASLGFSELGKQANQIDEMFSRLKASWADVESAFEGLLDEMEALLD